MTRPAAYAMMQTLNRGSYEMGDLTQSTYESTELALAVDWDEQRDRRAAQAREIREERRAARRMAEAVLVVECRHCHSFVDVPALQYDGERGHLCATCAHHGAWV
jgi:hypothetical protein